MVEHPLLLEITGFNLHYPANVLLKFRSLLSGQQLGWNSLLILSSWGH
ncbi:hypothetical protein PAT3040_00067 [Paenibacillus agaridevorans]|uniref:Uncharacterized protein n=1 Tax=Paenibacillus agaridevorans TaxID=171404 RepID=A0A2R5EP90_9BACL|nr:hypothetical protein PAT3040_00067 [Paenibacillus agaridevorans]